MRLGCTGCLAALGLLALLALAAGGTVGAGMRMLARPDRPPPAATTAADGSRAQQKIFDLSRRARLSQPVTLTEGEINALLDRHLVGARGVRLKTLSVRLEGDDRMEVTGQVPLRELVEDAGLGALAGVLPARWLERPVWIHVGAHAYVDGGPPRQLRLDVEHFAVGRQRLPARMLRLLLDPAAVGLLRWPLPGHVDSVTIERGRVVIRGDP